MVKMMYYWLTESLNVNKIYLVILSFKSWIKTDKINKIIVKKPLIRIKLTSFKTQHVLFPLSEINYTCNCFNFQIYIYIPNEILNSPNNSKQIRDYGLQIY